MEFELVPLGDPEDEKIIDAGLFELVPQSVAERERRWKRTPVPRHPAPQYDITYPGPSFVQKGIRELRYVGKVLSEEGKELIEGEGPEPLEGIYPGQPAEYQLVPETEGSALSEAFRRVMDLDRKLSAPIDKFMRGKLGAFDTATIPAANWLKSGFRGMMYARTPGYSVTDKRAKIVENLQPQAAFQMLTRGDPNDPGLPTMTPKAAKQFIDDINNGVLMESVIWIGILGHQGYQLARSAPTIFRAMKGEFMEMLMKDELMPLAERLRAVGLSKERMTEIHRGVGAPPTPEELGKYEQIGKVFRRRYRGPLEFVRRWFATGPEKKPKYEGPPQLRFLPGARGVTLQEMDMSARIKAHEGKAAEFLGKHGEAPFEIFTGKPHGKMGEMVVRVTPSVKMPGGWQVTFFDKEGPFRDLQYKDYGKMLYELQALEGVSLDNAKVRQIPAPKPSEPAPKPREGEGAYEGVGEKMPSTGITEAPPVRTAPVEAGATSVEAIKRQKEGKFAFFDTKNGSLTLDTSVDAVDRPAGRFEIKAWVDNQGKITMLDYGSGIDPRMKEGQAKRAAVLIKGRLSEEKVTKEREARLAEKKKTEEDFAAEIKKYSLEELEKAYEARTKRVESATMEDMRDRTLERLGKERNMLRVRIDELKRETHADWFEKRMRETRTGMEGKIPPQKRKRYETFPEYDALVKEIDTAIKTAPEETPPEDKPFVKFKTDGEHEIINTKGTLKTYKKMVEKNRYFYMGTALKKGPSPQPKAGGPGRQEKVGPLIPLERKGWFTDGHILLKGEPPRTAKPSEMHETPMPEENLKQVMPKKGDLKPADLQYYALETPEGERFVSPDPIPADANEIPLAVFKVGNFFAGYDQRIFNVARNRYPDATYKISTGHDDGKLAIYDKGELVGLLMPMAPGERAEKMMALTKKPAAYKEAIEAGMITETEATKEARKVDAAKARARKAEEEKVKKMAEKPPAHVKEAERVASEWTSDKDWAGNTIWRLKGTEWKIREERPGIAKRFTVLKGEGDNQQSIDRFSTLTKAKQAIVAEIEAGEPSVGPKTKSYEMASMGLYATGEQEYAAPLKAVIDLPEIVEMARQLGKGAFPKIVTKIQSMYGGIVQGAFTPSGQGRIRLWAGIFKDINQARAVLAHEVGHWIDYLPEKTISRGNILGRIASLKKYMKRTLPRRPGAKEELTQADRRRLRYQAKKLIEAEYKDKWIDEEIERELPISSDDVLAIWNSVEAALKENPELYRFVQTLNTAEKKAIVKAALKGQVEERVRRFAKRVKEKTGKKIKVEPTADLISKKYEELIKKEIEKLRLFKASEMMDELKDLSRTWKPFDPAANPAYTAYRYRSTELYADAISALFNAPGLLRSKAPNFYEGFFNYLENKPQIKELYEGIQDEITAGTTDNSLTKRTYEGFRRGDDAYALALEKKKHGWLDYIGRDLIDANWAILKKVRKTGDINIDPRKNPRYKLEEMAYTGSEVEWILGQTLQNVIRPLEDVGLDWDNFGFYRFLKRVSSERAEVANPRGWHKERALKKLEALKQQEWRGERWEAVEKADKAFNKTREYLIDKVEKAGRYNPEFVEIMRGNVGDYVTFDVVHYIEKRHGAAPAAKIFPVKGTLADVANPATATILKDIAILKATNRQIAAESVVNFLKEYYPKEVRPADYRWSGRFREIKDPPRGEDLGLIAYLKNGKAAGYYTDRWIADIFDRNSLESNVVAQILRMIARPFRMIFTELNPGFMLFNACRDFMRGAQMLPKANITNFITHWTKALKPAFKSVYGIPSGVVEEMLKGNMLISIEGVRGLSPQDKEIERLLARYRMAPPPTWNKKILKPFGDFFNFISNIGRGIERTPKVAGYTYLTQRFPDMAKEVKGHLVRSRAGSPDFLRLGRGYPFYNNLLLFSNAMKEGHRGDYEAMSDNPAEFWYKKAKYIYLPKLLMYAGSIGLLGAGIKEVYDGVTSYDMANYLVVPLGITPSGNSVYLRIPTDEGSRLLGGVLMKGLQRDRQKYLTGIFDYMSGQAPTLNPGVENLIHVITYLSGHNPYDAFRGKYALGDQVFAAYDERTHKAFVRWLANKSGSGIVYHFRSDDIKRINDELQDILHYPFVTNIIGRFVKVSQAGVREKIKLERELVKRNEARKILNAREALIKLINEEPLTTKDMIDLAAKPDVFDRGFMKALARRYGNVVAEEMWSVYQTGTTEEKFRVLQQIVELQALGRAGRKYRWLWEKREERRK